MGDLNRREKNLCAPDLIECLRTLGGWLKGSSQTQKGIPSYSIRSDDGVDKSLISLFLTQGCRVQEQHALAILEFFEDRNLRTTFDCLSENITEFERSSDIDNDIVKQIRKSLTSKGKSYSDC